MVACGFSSSQLTSWPLSSQAFVLAARLKFSCLSRVVNNAWRTIGIIFTFIPLSFFVSSLSRNISTIRNSSTALSLICGTAFLGLRSCNNEWMDTVGWISSRNVNGRRLTEG